MQIQEAGIGFSIQTRVADYVTTLAELLITFYRSELSNLRQRARESDESTFPSYFPNGTSNDIRVTGRENGGEMTRIHRSGIKGSSSLSVSRLREDAAIKIRDKERERAGKGNGEGGDRWKRNNRDRYR